MAEVERILVDAMLGRLARWLRLLGLDATLLQRPPSQPPPDQLLLTRRVKLRGRRGVVFIEHDRLVDQLRQTVGLPGLNIRPEAFFTRCLECNQPVRAIGRDQAAAVVADHVLMTAERFTQCPRCGKVFWPGSHGQRALEFLRQAGAWPIHPNGRRGDANRSEIAEQGS
ncbi:protein of unknown function DUF82 [Desulfarculus baarsii DSM 2075]|uniref:Mut7-C RNAse domain-containing protein n=1 Tax=Desulfarculus baarsii (strain ATCC 33931 / DSM 2075 / LMG 7858 / VKM B-1802 / 2st14) TaxID=644282 RepID=E1QKZ4_DESB2|nr:Mut7-C RNAse domain-containing protein [Desulfarculus baarsii]ADK85259.1 protein of unknown function DUF82 [Desulfarculus baarsii DSM 2075]